ncbi:MAG TPA: hypothetical protein VMF68_02060 [Spirochaetia bacterium]|nr:hypothetical protein [Spirochaetia bacterium]
MSTTPTTSEPRRRSYTVLGGPRWDRVRRHPYPLTFLVLGRGDRLFKAELLKDLLARSLGEVLWVEASEASPDVEPLSREFPQVRFLLVADDSTPGDRVNIGMEEARAPMVMVMWSDTRLAAFPDAGIGPLEKSGVLCTVPVARTSRDEPVPSWQAPLWKKRRFSLAWHAPRSDGQRVLFPFDYCGLYHRLKFSQTGGFDAEVANPYWQKLDFGLRCFLWGERVLGSLKIAITYTGAPPEENTTPDQGYKKTWLKNLAVRTRNEMGALPSWRALDYMIHSDLGPLVAVKEFRDAQRWVHQHRFRFRRDPRELVDGWERS